jgi:predicted TPR repeat methyltransferase
VKKGGFFAFSLERGARYPFHLTDTGRYTHSADHVRDVATNAGLTVMRLDESFLRMEYGAEVIGLFVLLCQE